MKWIDIKSESDLPKKTGEYIYETASGFVGKTVFVVPRTPINEHWENKNIVRWLDESEPSPSMGAEEIEKWYREWCMENPCGIGRAGLDLLKDFASSHQPCGYSREQIKKYCDEIYPLEDPGKEMFHDNFTQSARRLAFMECFDYLQSLTQQGSGNNKTD